MRKRNRVDN